VLAYFRRLWVPRDLFDGGFGRVIVADTDESAFAMVRQLTAPDRWEVRYAGTALELLRLLRAGPARLAVVNLSMLDDAWLVAEDLRERSRRGLRVVITTDEHNEVNERRARLIAPVFYAPKPLNILLLSRVLEGALGQAV